MPSYHTTRPRSAEIRGEAAPPDPVTVGYLGASLTMIRKDGGPVHAWANQAHHVAGRIGHASCRRRGAWIGAGVLLGDELQTRSGPCLRGIRPANDSMIS